MAPSAKKPTTTSTAARRDNESDTNPNEVPRMVASRANMPQKPNIWAVLSGGESNPTTVRLEAWVAPMPAPANSPSP